MSALDRLAAACGIEAEYLDAARQLRATSAYTKRALLGMLGVEARDEAHAAATLAARELDEWRQPLPPVVVAYADGSELALDVTLPADTDRVAWALELEDGDHRSGAAAFSALRAGAAKTVDGAALERRRLVLPRDLPYGYHVLRVEPGSARTTFVVTPGRCWLPDGFPHRTYWGVALQVYLLRSHTNWGIGDFGDLRDVATTLRDSGADVVGLNPFHAMFLDQPEHASPYSPAGRLFLNVLNIDVAAVPGYATCARAQARVAAPEFVRRLTACREGGSVRYAQVSELKLPVLRELFACFESEAEPAQRRAFAAFVEERGAPLQEACVFQALRNHFAAASEPLDDWRAWPAALRDPHSATVAAFASEHTDEVRFLSWLQWVADVQLAAAAEAASGMAVGLYRDLAVGADPRGVETWGNQRAVIAGAQVGAPPDVYNPAGQGWGLPPFHPAALRAEAYRSFVQLLRANMRYAGAMRIDHAMGLQRLYLIPHGNAPADGAYVAYPREDLIGILALESQRNRCLVIGEDLGTVPDGFVERMARAGILSYRVLFFETEPAGDFRAPARYPKLALAVAGNHDLPTLRAWWTGSDIDLRERLLLVTGAAAAAMRRQRERERGLLRAALAREGLVPEGDILGEDDLLPAVHAFLARTPCMLAMAQLDDIARETEPVNVPATFDEYPNWRRRLSLSIEDLPANALFASIAKAFAREHRGAELP